MNKYTNKWMNKQITKRMLIIGYDFDDSDDCHGNDYGDTTLGTVHKYFGGGLGKMEGAKKVLSYQKGGTKKFSVVKRGGQKSLVKLKV